MNSEKANKIFDAIESIRITSYEDEEVLDLPQICVIGGKSDMKSSLLSCLTSIQLPKSIKQPVIVRYIKSDSEKKFQVDGKNCNTLDDIVNQIEKVDTNSKPIYVKIMGKDVVPFTIVDLFGLTQQPNNQDAKDMIEKYLVGKNTIIIYCKSSKNDLMKGLIDKFDSDRGRTIEIIESSNEDVEDDYVNMKASSQSDDKMIKEIKLFQGRDFFEVYNSNKFDSSAFKYLRDVFLPDLLTSRIVMDSKSIENIVFEK